MELATDLFFSPSPIGVLLAFIAIAGMAVARYFRVDFARIVVILMFVMAASASLAALIRFDGTGLEWAGMSLVLFGIAVWAYCLPSEEEEH